MAANLLSSLLEFYPAYKYNKRGVNTAPQRQLLGQITNIADAQMNPDNPAYQRLYAQKRQAGQRNLAEALAMAGRQNRKAAAMGRTPLFSPERGGETMFRSLMQGYEDVQDSAATQTSQSLASGASTLNNAFNMQNQITGLEDTSKKRKLKSYGNLAGALRGIFGL